MPPIWHAAATILTVWAFFFILHIWTRPTKYSRTDQIGYTVVVLFLGALYWALALHSLPQ